MNRLAGERSPYLLQHKNNPVEWWPWGEAAFAAAREAGRPVFLSIGYSTCHWCHVMAHESFENPGIARVMNEHFVNIKVDREERPDVDRLYMAFVQATTGSGGWPMSVWLTPEGKPFFGGTYFPPTDRHGRAGFPNVLLQIARLWREERGRVEREGARVMEALKEVRSEKGEGGRGKSEGGGGGREELPERALRRGFEGFSGGFDEENGGFGGAPKFPRPAVVNFLLRFGTRAGGADGERALRMALVTLRRMAAGGMRDHLGGGFHRYSVDAYWHVPHFEKMLYDQAQLACSYVEAWQVTKEEAFAEIARETIEYVLRDLRDGRGGFFSAEDADSLVAHGRPEHAEGAFYVWTREEIAEALSNSTHRQDADATVFCRHYGVVEEGNAPAESDPQGEFRGKNILIERESIEATAKASGMTAVEVRESLARSRKTLFELRAERPRPHLDDKVLTAWNGLMISALAKAGAAFGDERYVNAAREAADFVRAELDRDGGLLRAWRGGAGTVAGFAEDHAFLIQGLLDLYEATFEEEWMAWALNLQARQDAVFWDEEVGNYFSSAGGDPLLAVRMKDDYDGAEPSANSVSAVNLLRMARMFHDEAMETRARRILVASQVALDRAPTAVPQMLVALDLATSPPAQAVVAGDDARAWIARLHGEFAPRRVKVHAKADGILAKRNPELAAMGPVGGRTALYVCEDFVCRAPEVFGT